MNKKKHRYILIKYVSEALNTEKTKSSQIVQLT